MRAGNFASAREAALLPNIPVSVYDVSSTPSTPTWSPCTDSKPEKRVLAWRKLPCDIYAPLVSEMKMEAPLPGQEMVPLPSPPLRNILRDASKAFTD